MGFQVIGVVVNPLFVELVNRRAKRLGYDISAKCSTFDDYELDRKFDLIFFYECLHHAVRPWVLLDKLARNLTEIGRVALAGEPINDFWWKSWGMRLDAMSVY